MLHDIDRVNQFSDTETRPLLSDIVPGIKKKFQGKKEGCTLENGEAMVFMPSVYAFNPSDRLSVVEGMSAIAAFEGEPGKRTGTHHFTWIEPPVKQSLIENVAKGIIKVRKIYIETECNSKERDILLRGKLESVLSGLIRHKKTSCRHPEDMPASGKSAAPGRKKAPRALDIAELPEEAQVGIREHIEKMHMNWADTPVPALDNRTPREAVKEPEGKKRVVRLTNDWENMQSRMKEQQFVFNFNKLRKSLDISLE